MKFIGIILAGGKSEKMDNLTRSRAIAALPVACNYKAIDFALSNMTNSGIKKVAVITQYNSQSLNEHLSSSKWWDFGRKQGGLFVFSPFISKENSLWYRGTADAIHQNIEFLKESHEPYVVISNADIICKVDYNKVLDYHVSKKADITLIAKRLDEGADPRRYGVIDLDENNKVLDIEEKPIVPQTNIINTGIYVIRRRLLIDLLEEVAAEDRYDFVTDIIIRYRRQKKIFAYMLQDYWENVSSIESYFKVNMDFLKAETRRSLIKTAPYIYSKAIDEPPAKFNHPARVVNSLVAGGCIINGTVENSVLFRKVYIGENVTIRNSIILENCYIGNNVYIENCIIDSKANINPGTVYKGDGQNPKVIFENNPFFNH